MMQHVVRDPVGVLIGLPTLGHQFGYANILPLYLVLLAVSPFALMVAWRRPGWLLMGSLLLWAVTAEFVWNLPTYPVQGGWFFNPFAWQVVFTLGLLTGVALRDGRRFVPVRRWLQWVSGGFLVLSFCWVNVPAVSEFMNHTLWMAQEAGVPTWITSFDKTYVTAPRLLHIMALAYFLSSLPVVKRIAGSSVGAPFSLLGRQALPVFALGSILSFLFQGIKMETGNDPVIDAGLIVTGLGLQFALASARQYWPKAAVKP